MTMYFLIMDFWYTNALMGIAKPEWLLVGGEKKNFYAFVF